MKNPKNTVCFYCGAEKEGLTFFIGASRSPQWVMVEGTGRICCPTCWERGARDGREAIERHIKEHNKSHGRLQNG